MPEVLSSEVIETLAGGEVLARVDTLGLVGALAQVASRSTNAPRRIAGLGVELGKILAGRSDVAAESRDWRFANRAWRDNPGFRRLAQTYLAWERTVEQVIADAELDWRTEERARFATKIDQRAGTHQFPPPQPRSPRACLRDRWQEHGARVAQHHP